MNNPIMLTF